MIEAARLIRLVERQIADAPENLLLTAGLFLLRVAELAGDDAGLRARAGALLLMLCTRMTDEERTPLLHDMAPLFDGPVAGDVGAACVASARGLVEPTAFAARLWLRAAGALRRGGRDAMEAVGAGLAAAESTCRAGGWLGAPAALGPALADEVGALARGRWGPPAHAALMAWLLGEIAGDRAAHALAVHRVLLPHRDAAAECYPAVVPWLGLAAVQELLAAGPLDCEALCEAIAVRLAQLGDPRAAIALIDRHPFSSRHACDEVQRHLLPHLPHAEARALIDARARAGDPFSPLAPEVLAQMSDEEIARLVAERRPLGFGQLAALAHDLPPRHRPALLAELIRSPEGGDHPEALFLLLDHAHEVSADLRDQLVARSIEVLETKTGGWLSCYDGLDLARMLPALPVDVRIELVSALDRLLASG